MRLKALISLVIFSVFAQSAFSETFVTNDPLNGRGPSGKRVEVSTYEGNLYVRVFPQKSVVSFGAQMDRVTLNQALVLTFKFEDHPHERFLKRLPSQDLSEPIKVYRQPTTYDHDEFILTNNTLYGDFESVQLTSPLHEKVIAKTRPEGALTQQTQLAKQLKNLSVAEGSDNSSLNISALGVFSTRTRSIASAPKAAPEDDYDRLDGHGESGKRVDVIEWEGNLEIHVYPAGSLEGLALKIDRRNKNRPVMVIGYRFKDSPSKQHIRRNILGIPMSEPLHVYKDKKEHEFDKIVVTNQPVKKDSLVAIALDPEPTRLYPEGYEKELKERRNGVPFGEERAPAGDEGSQSNDSNDIGFGGQ